jgi:hypothetical protein
MNRGTRIRKGFLSFSVILGMALFVSGTNAETLKSAKSVSEISKLISKELLIGLNQRPPELKGVKNWVQTSYLFSEFGLPDY